MIRTRARLDSRRWWTGLATLAPLGALLAVFVMSGSASASVMAVGPESYYGPISDFASMCMDLRGNLVTNYQPVQIYTCNQTGAQQWNFDGNNNTIQLGENGGMCLDIYAGGTWNGDTVDLYPCNGTGAQVWIQRADGTLFNPQSGKCLDDTNWSTTPGTQLQIWQCDGAVAQYWAFRH